MCGRSVNKETLFVDCIKVTKGKTPTTTTIVSDLLLYGYTTTNNNKICKQKQSHKFNLSRNSCSNLGAVQFILENSCTATKTTGNQNKNRNSQRVRRYKQSASFRESIRMCGKFSATNVPCFKHFLFICFFSVEIPLMRVSFSFLSHYLFCRILIKKKTPYKMHVCKQVFNNAHERRTLKLHSLMANAFYRLKFFIFIFLSFFSDEWKSGVIKKTCSNSVQLWKCTLHTQMNVLIIVTAPSCLWYSFGLFTITKCDCVHRTNKKRILFSFKWSPSFFCHAFLTFLCHRPIKWVKIDNSTHYNGHMLRLFSEANEWRSAQPMNTAIAKRVNVFVGVLLKEPTT